MKQTTIFIGMETSGALRRRFQARGVITVSVDTLPAEDTHSGVLAMGGHIEGDVFEKFAELHAMGWRFDAGIFHPTCTFLTNSAAWALKDPDFERYPGVGYHQKVSPETLTGEARRVARDAAKSDVQRILDLPIPVKILENPNGAITQVRRATQIIHPNQFGEDASKGTVLIMEGIGPMPIDRDKFFPPRLVCQGCRKTWKYGTEPDGCDSCGAEASRILPRWSNQTDTGQSNVTPSKGRWKDRSRTYPGIADALVAHICDHLGVPASFTTTPSKIAQDHADQVRDLASEGRAASKVDR